MKRALFDLLLLEIKSTMTEQNLRQYALARQIVKALAN